MEGLKVPLKRILLAGMEVVKKIEALNGTPPKKACVIEDCGELPE